MKVEVHSDRVSSQSDPDLGDMFTSVMIKFSASEVAKACEAEPGLMQILQAKPKSPSDLLDKFQMMARVLERMGTTSSTANNKISVKQLVQEQADRFQGGWVDSQRDGA